MSEVLLEEIDGKVLTLTLNRPDSYNAINPDLRDRLIAALEGAQGSQVACVVIRGSGRGFCAGIDLKSGSGGVAGDALMDYMRRSTQALVRAVLGCSVPLISAVHGVCAGVALILALGADHCIATDDARFSAPFIHRALVPDGASIYLLPRLVGLGRAKRVLLFGEDVVATEALATGMIGEVVPAEELHDAVVRRSAQLAALPQAALAYTKSMLLRSFDVDFESALFAERAGQALMSTTSDYGEGVAAFLERRAPRFGAGDTTA
ncbi:MAG: enoyl-CoA hydratase/isomerase family protein [Acidimicrobiales bacterium]